MTQGETVRVLRSVLGCTYLNFAIMGLLFVIVTSSSLSLMD